MAPDLYRQAPLVLVSIQLGFPASGKFFKGLTPSGSILFVSIQLGFPASGKEIANLQAADKQSVSIQLGFPASGKENSCNTTLRMSSCFHSIRFPSEWEAGHVVTLPPAAPRVSIQLGFPASGKRPTAKRFWLARQRSFHSIRFPSEWEANTLSTGAGSLSFPFN